MLFVLRCNGRLLTGTSDRHSCCDQQDSTGLTFMIAGQIDLPVLAHLLVSFWRKRLNLSWVADASQSSQINPGRAARYAVANA
jgi:hypothetical protein